MVDFDALNRKTQRERNTCVNRYNESTRGNYSTPNFARLNANTYYANNGQYPDSRRYW